MSADPRDEAAESFKEWQKARAFVQARDALIAAALAWEANDPSTDLNQNEWSLEVAVRAYREAKAGRDAK